MRSSPAGAAEPGGRRTTTHAHSAEGLDAPIWSREETIDAYDVGLDRQLALANRVRCEAPTRMEGSRTCRGARRRPDPAFDLAAATGALEASAGEEGVNPDRTYILPRLRTLRGPGRSAVVPVPSW
jgi:hypothetical protein